MFHACVLCSLSACVKRVDVKRKMGRDSVSQAHRILFIYSHSSLMLDVIKRNCGKTEEKRASEEERW